MSDDLRNMILQFVQHINTTFRMFIFCDRIFQYIKYKNIPMSVMLVYTTCFMVLLIEVT